jgi:serine/threonine-protein kinase
MAGQVYLGRYEVVRPLGEGGMGKVYLARQKDNARFVVVKVMHEHLANDARFRQNFLRETRLMALFHHRNAVQLYEASVDDARQLCIVMEYMEGVTLQELVKRHGPLLPLRAGRLLGQLCDVLQAAHDAGIVHRDLTASNMVLVGEGTPEETLKVMDFGMARACGSGPYFALEKLVGTGDNIGGGTPDYICPEQIRSEEVDHRGDIYSVGVLLFFMLTGRLPFENAASVQEILTSHVDRKPPTFAEVGCVETVPHGVEGVVLACLAKFPVERPQSARELGLRFEKALGQKILVPPLTASGVRRAAEIRAFINPREQVDYLEAWMPESIAVVKLRGFVGDMGGEVVDSEPGLIRVQLPAPGTVEDPRPPGFLGWFGIAKRPLPSPNLAAMELHMEKTPGNNRLAIRVVMRPEKPKQPVDAHEWKVWTQQIVRELRAYLISR